MLRSRLLQWLLDRIIPRYEFLASAAAIVGIAGGLSSLFGGDNQGGVPNPNQYIYYNPAQQRQAADEWMRLLNQGGGLEQGLSRTVSPAMLNALQTGLGTSNAGLTALPPQLQAAYGNIGTADQLYAQLMGGMGARSMGNLENAGMSTWLNALDPQNALHDRIKQSLIDTGRAGQAARGIEMGGVGQGMENDLSRNFEIDWSNQLLGRQVQGLTALERALGTGSQIGQQDFGASSNFYGQIPAALTGGAMAPQTAQGLNAQYLSTILNQLGGGYQQYGVNPLFQTQNQIMPFLTGGVGAGANAFQGAMANYGARAGAQTAGVEALGTGLQQLGEGPVGSWLNSMWGSGSPSAPFNYNDQTTWSPSR